MIVLNFNHFQLKAELFDTTIAQKFAHGLPYLIDLVGWGDELYGAIGVDLGEESPVPTIPPGGLAYTNHGNYFCIFFGQTPAWPVEHIGKIVDDWQNVLNRGLRQVTVSNQ